MLDSEQYETVRTSPVFRGFKYIKTFTPLRRFTTSHGGTVRFMQKQMDDGIAAGDAKKMITIFPDVISERVLNRGFMIDWQDRLFADCVLVRFEDAKLNPKAVFTALCAFLDLPYSETMTYCSLDGERDPLEFSTNVRGFDTASVYKTYDEYINNAEGIYLEYFLRDAYEYYGYGFQYYDGSPMDEARVRELVDGFDTLNGYIDAALRRALLNGGLTVTDKGANVADKDVEQNMKEVVEKIVAQRRINENENRMKNAKMLMRGLNFINRKGQPLHMMPRLELDPALLEQPLYH